MDRPRLARAGGQLVVDVDRLLSPEQRANMRVDQIKEKYGRLLVYWWCEGLDPSTRQAVKALVDAATKTSLRTCQRCGEPGRCFGVGGVEGWYATLCQGHLAEEIRSRGRPVKVAVDDEGTTISPAPGETPADIAGRAWQAAEERSRSGGAAT